MRKKIFMSILFFVLMHSLSSSSLFDFFIPFTIGYDEKKMLTGYSRCVKDDTVVIGTVGIGNNSASYTTICEKENDKWRIVKTFHNSDFKWKYTGPISIAMNSHYIVLGLDAPRGKKGIVVVLKKNRR